MGWTTYYYRCPICGYIEMASTEAALKERVEKHVLAPTLDTLGLAEVKKTMLERKIQKALQKIEKDFNDNDW